MKIDLTGQRFGKWTVIEEGTRLFYWVCECGCARHTRKELRSWMLRAAKTTHCGCEHKSRLRRDRDKAHHVEITRWDEANRPIPRRRLERIAELRIPRTEPCGRVTAATLESMRLEALEFHMERAGLTFSPPELAAGAL